MKRLLIGLAALFPSIANANCPFTVDGMIPKQSLTELIAKAKALNVEKDEFESTSQYEARMAAASEGLFPEVTAIELSFPSLTEYDADKQMVTVSRFSLSSTCLLLETALPAAAKAFTFKKPPGGYALGSPYCLVHEVERTEGASYEASNSYGATVNVTPITIKQEGLYFGYGYVGQELIPYSPTNDIFSFEAAPEEARSLKDNAVLVFGISPKAPFYVPGSYYIGAKIRSPQSLTFKLDLLATELICVGIGDRKTGRIFAVKDIPK